MDKYKMLRRDIIRWVSLALTAAIAIWTLQHGLTLWITAYFFVIALLNILNCYPLTVVYILSGLLMMFLLLNRLIALSITNILLLFFVIDSMRAFSKVYRVTPDLRKTRSGKDAFMRLVAKEEITSRLWCKLKMENQRG